MKQRPRVLAKAAAAMSPRLHTLVSLCLRSPTCTERPHSAAIAATGNMHAPPAALLPQAGRQPLLPAAASSPPQLLAAAPATLLLTCP